MDGLLDFFGGFMPQDFAGQAMTPEMQNEFARNAMMQVGASMLMPITRIGPNPQIDYLAPLRALSGLPAMGQQYAAQQAKQMTAAEDIEYTRGRREFEESQRPLQERVDSLTASLKELQLSEAQKAAERADSLEQQEKDFTLEMNIDSYPDHVRRAIEGSVAAGNYAEARSLAYQWDSSAYEEQQDRSRRLTSIREWEEVLGEDSDLAAIMVDDPVRGGQELKRRREGRESSGSAMSYEDLDKKYVDTVKEYVQKQTFEYPDPENSRKTLKVKGYGLRNPDQPVEPDNIITDPLEAEVHGAEQLKRSGNLGVISNDPMWRINKLAPEFKSEGMVDVAINMLVNKGTYKVDATTTVQELREKFADDIQEAYKRAGRGGVDAFLRQAAGLGVE